MHTGRHIVMSDPAYYEVCYAINPWMRPEMWARNPAAQAQAAQTAWYDLAGRLQELGFTLEVVPAVPGLPDLVFPANAAIVLDGRALLARFRHPQRRGEEQWFQHFFKNLVQRGLLTAWEILPEGVYQEGAGDCIWDSRRRLFWAGYGPRSSLEAAGYVQAYFRQEIVALELATADFYHLDTCFCPLPGGELLYYPDAFSAAGRASIAARVPAELRIAATAEEAASFCLNAVALDRDLVMAPPPPRLRKALEERGYRCHDVDLSRFMLSGGAAYCMTLRLDLRSSTARTSDADLKLLHRERQRSRQDFQIESGTRLGGS